MTMRLKHYDCSLSNIQTTEKPKTLLIHSLVENIQSVLPLPHREPCNNYLRDILSQGWWSRWLYQKGGKSEPCRNQGNRREKKNLCLRRSLHSMGQLPRQNDFYRDAWEYWRKRYPKVNWSSKNLIKRVKGQSTWFSIYLCHENSQYSWIAESHFAMIIEEFTF